MKIIKRISDNVVLYSGDTLVMTGNDARNNDWVDTNTTTKNSTITEAILPEDWVGGAYTFDGSVWAQTPEFIASLVILAEAKRIQKVPQSVKMRQARLALHQVGKLETVEQNIQLLDKPAQIEWEFAETVERSSPLVTKLSELLNMSTAEVDQLFISACTL
jgi:hypothetical protein